MPNGDHQHRIPFPTPQDRLRQLEANSSNTIDLVLALHALLVAKGLSSHEEIDRIVKIVADARPKLGKEFTIEEGIKAIVAAFRIEMQGGKGGEDNV